LPPQPLHEGKGELDISLTQKNIEVLGKAIEHLTDQIKDETEARGHKGSKATVTKESTVHTNMGNHLVNTANTGVNIVGSLTSGNFAGAAISGIRGVSSLLQGSGKAVGSQAGLENIAKILGGLGVVGLVGGAVLAGGNALSEKYEGALPDIERFQQRFGNHINRNSSSLNSTVGLQWYNRAATLSLGTGKTTSEMMDAAESAGRYGIKDAETALATSRKDVMWERFTGADLSTIQNLSGTSRRYGGDEQAVSTAFAGLKASGMEKGQFDEFLNAIQRIMEDGIAKGFVRGSTEIASNMAMLHKLSGESPLWTGEQGANRLINMSNAVANATNLGRVEDVISFGAAHEIVASRHDEEGKRSLLEGSQEGNGQRTGGVYTGTYVDTMQILERGVTAELLKHQFESVNKLEGNNAAGAIERYRQMYNLNYTGAAQVWKMQGAYLNDPGKFSAEEQADTIKRFQEDPEYQSDSTRLQNVLTRLDTSLVNLGKSAFNIKIGGLEKVEGLVEKISQRMTESRYKASIKESTGGVFDDYFMAAEKKNIREMQHGLSSGLRGTAEQQEATVNILKAFEELNPMQRMYANKKNALNAINWSDPEAAWKEFQQVDFSVPEGREIHPAYQLHKSGLFGGEVKAGELSELTLSMLGHETKGKEDLGGEFAKLVAGTINSNPELLDMKGFTQQLHDLANTFDRTAGNKAEDRILDSGEYKDLIHLFTNLIRAIEKEKNTTIHLYTD
jgi:hypothetical protein